jgi:DNA-binding transcriptional MerR regulator
VKIIYLLKDLSVKTGLSIYTIKYYLKLELLKEIARSPDTNFRYFDDTTVKRLEMIRKMRRQDLSIKEIKKRLKVT